MIRQRAFAVACAATATTVLGLVAAPSQAISLGSLLNSTSDPFIFTSNGNSFIDGDLEFSNFSWQIATNCLPRGSNCGGAVGPLNPEFITVGPATTPNGFGLKYNDNFKAEAGYFIDFSLTYDVAVIGDGPDITDFHSIFEGPVYPGLVEISENITDKSTGKLLTSLPLVVDNLPGNGTPDFEASVDLLYPVRSARVRKDILVDGTSGNADARFSTLDQEFSRTPKSVPEPSAMGGLLVFGSLGIGAMLKRQRQQSNKLALSATPNESGS